MDHYWIRVHGYFEEKKDNHTFCFKLLQVSWQNKREKVFFILKMTEAIYWIKGMWWHMACMP